MVSNATPVKQATASVAKRAATIVVVGCVAYFFWKAFSHNWQSVQAHRFELAYPYLVVAFAAAVATIILYDYAWFVTVNALSGRSAITFTQTLATVNTSGLTKYVPGKLWSFALQMYWLAKLGLSKSLILYVNAINMLVSMLAAVMLGLGFLLFSSDRYPWSTTLAWLAGLLLVDACCITFHGPILNWGILLLNRLLKRNVARIDVSTRLILRLHAIHLAASVASAVGGYALCFGIGYRIGVVQAMLVMSSLLLSEVVGYLAFLVPGGLGVREGIMYVMLGGAATGSLSLILPLATRAVNMIVEVALGLISLRLLKSLAGQEEAEPAPQSPSP
ncbi:MAG: hypothetical protein QM756_40125 [Polyangiaceae bacterium]